MADPYVTPFAVVVDTRENAPYDFHGIRADSRDGGGPVVVRIVRRGLPTGDYSLEGFEDEVAIERKSLDDLYGTLGGGRKRFEREMERLAAMRWACVVIEASWTRILTRPPVQSRLRPKTILRSVDAWSIRFPNVHWRTADTRGLAERMTFRLLERYWKERHDTSQRRSAVNKPKGVSG